MKTRKEIRNEIHILNETKNRMSALEWIFGGGQVMKTEKEIKDEIKALLRLSARSHAKPIIIALRWVLE